MSGLPEPLVPPEVDLRDFPYLPIDIARLFGSEFHARSDDTVWRAGFTLWLKCYHQVPASSIPDDDIAVTRLAELGRDVATWRQIKAEVLRGWIKCSDGRLYHPVVAEKALEAWIDKLAQRKSSAAGNAKRYGQTFDPAGFDSALEDSLTRLAGLNPNSKKLTRRVPKGISKDETGSPDALPSGDDIAPGGSLNGSGRDPVGTKNLSQRDPTGTDNSSHRDPAGSPDALPSGSQEKRREEKDKNYAPSRPKPARAKPSYPADFEDWWREYPTSPNMPKPEAAKAWAKLDDDDRAAAKAALPGFKAHCRKTPTYSPCYAQKWLNERRFDGFAPIAGGKNGGEGIVDFGGGYTAPESTVVMMIRRGSWAPHWGPKVGEPGCLVPRHVIEAAGH